MNHYLSVTISVYRLVGYVSPRSNEVGPERSFFAGVEGDLLGSSKGSVEDLRVRCAIRKGPRHPSQRKKKQGQAHASSQRVPPTRDALRSPLFWVRLLLLAALVW